MKKYSNKSDFGYKTNQSTDIGVVGDPANFYIYIDKPDNKLQPWSKRIHDLNIYHRLKQIHNDKELFIAECKKLFEENKNPW